MNSRLSWLNLGFSTVSMRNISREVADSYNQLLNAALLLAGVVAVHYLLFLLFRHWRKLKSWSLPGWLAFPFPELFVAAFILSGVAASATMLLGAAVVGGGWQPALVGGLAAAFLAGFAAAASWVVHRILKIYRQLGMVYLPRSRYAAYAIPKTPAVTAGGAAGAIGAAVATLGTAAADAAAKGAVAKATERNPRPWGDGASGRDLAAADAADAASSGGVRRSHRRLSGSDEDNTAGRLRTPAASSAAASARVILLEPDGESVSDYDEYNSGGELACGAKASATKDPVYTTAASVAGGGGVGGGLGPPVVAVGVVSPMSGSRTGSGSWPSLGTGTGSGKSPGKGGDSVGSSPMEGTEVKQQASGKQLAGLQEEAKGQDIGGGEGKEGEEGEEGHKEGGKGRWARWFSRLILGRWNRKEAVAPYRGMEPYRTRKYLKDGLSPRAAIRCLYPRDFAAEVTAERQEVRRRRRERRIAAASAGGASPATRAGVLSGRARSPPFSGVGSVSGGSAGSDPDGGAGPLEGRTGSSRAAWAGLEGGASREPSRTAATSRFAAASSPATGQGPGQGQGPSGYGLRGSSSAPWLVGATGAHGTESEPRALSYTGAGAQRSGARNPGPATGPSGWSRLGGDAGAPDPFVKSRIDGKDSRPSCRPAGVSHTIISTGPIHPLPTAAAMPAPPAAPLPPPPAPPPLMPLSPLLRGPGGDPGPSSASSNQSTGGGRGGPPRPLGPSQGLLGGSRSPLRLMGDTSRGSSGSHGLARAPTAAPAAVAPPPALRVSAVLPVPLLLTHGSAEPSIFLTQGAGDAPPNVLLLPSRSEPWPVTSRKNDCPGFNPVAAASSRMLTGASGASSAGPAPPDSEAAMASHAATRLPAAAQPPPPALMSLMSFGGNVNAGAYITGGGPQLLGSGGSRSSLAARPPSVRGGRNSALGGNGTDEDESCAGDSGDDAGGQQIMPHRRGTTDSFASHLAEITSPTGENAAAVNGPPLGAHAFPVGTFLGGGFGRLPLPLAGTGTTPGMTLAAGGAPMLSYNRLQSQRFYLQAAPGAPRPRGGEKRSSSSEDESLGDEVMDVEKRCLLARLEVYERYGMTFEENRGNRRLAAMFYIAVVLNSVIPGMLLGVQAGGQMDPGSTAAFATNIALLAFKGSYSLYLTFVLPYINVVLIVTEIICMWLETIVVVCIVIITINSRWTTASTDTLSATTLNTTSIASSDNSTIVVDNRIARAGDAMLACELIVLAVQIAAMLVTTIIPAGITIARVVRLRLVHNREKRVRKAREAAERAAALEAGKAQGKEQKWAGEELPTRLGLGAPVDARKGDRGSGGDQGGGGDGGKGAGGAVGPGAGDQVSGIQGVKGEGALPSPKVPSGKDAGS